MQNQTPAKLSTDQVRHVAKLARLRLADDQLERYRTQLAAILTHIRKLQELDLSGVEPMAHPMELTGKLAEDKPGATLSLEQVLLNAPAVEDRYLAVPKVLADQEG